jgi:hypothetical protein
VVHGISLEEAQALVDALATREVPDIWSVGGKKRVLRKNLSSADQTLLLLYSEADPVLVEDLCDWIEYSRLDLYESRVLFPLHRSRLIEWDRDVGNATISPSGCRHVEIEILRLPA